MIRYAFELGREQTLSRAEIRAVLRTRHIEYTTLPEEKGFFLFETTSALDATDLMNTLGGTVKILEQVAERNKTPQAILTAYLEKTLPTGKIEFSLHGPNAERLAIQIKKELKTNGRSVRYVPPKNTATILHNKLDEKGTDIHLMNSGMFVTRAIQPIEAFTERDYGRPHSDSRSGMLPPKLARIMVNLSEAKQNDVLLDAFCGSGTVLMEALSLHFTHIIGSDLSAKAVDESKKNCDWLTEKYSLSAKQLDISKRDAQKIHEHLKATSVDAIVSEPYLGKPLTGKESREVLVAQIQELKILYINTFKAFHKILKDEGTIIFVIPRFRTGKDWTRIPCIEEIKKIGFVPTPFDHNVDSLLYWRETQHVGREIWKFRKK